MLGFSTHRRLSKLEEDYARLKRDFDALEVDMADLYDKVKKAMGRYVKNKALIEAQAERQAEEQTLVPLTGDGQTHSLLTDRQRVIQQEILRRRAGG